MRAVVQCGMLFLCGLLGESARGADPDLFRDRVAPIFERHCLACHRGDKPKGGLSLAGSREAQAGGDSGKVIEPLQPENSLLLDVITGDSPSMPKEGPPLAPDQVAVIRQWIAAGADWPAGIALRDRRLAGADDDWWSLRPLLAPSVPADNSGWARNPIDGFVLARSQEAGLSHAPEADRRTLVRRITYDLHGLPPTPDEVETFLTDESPDALERLVDRLLASPHYGERWGRHWLDIVHYGESHGYDKDKPRPNAWPYRDYVIEAFNSDTPYVRFVQEQLAGDVLFPGDPRGVVATGFIAAGPWDFVGHVELAEGTLDKKITRSNDRDDMVATAMSTFQSLTVHCARCHNHKFDPIAQEDYYRLQAVFAGIDRADRPFDPDPQMFARREALTSARASLEARQQELAAKVAAVTSPEIRATDERLAELQKELGALPKPEGQSSPTNGYHRQIEAAPNVVKWVQVDLGESRPIEEILLIPARPTDFPDTPGFGFPSRFRVELSDDDAFAQRQVVRDETAADFPNPGDKPLVVSVKERVAARFVRVTATRLWPRTNDFVLALGELQVISRNKNVARQGKVTALDSIEAGRWSTRHLVDGFSSRAPLGETAPLSKELARREELTQTIARLTAARGELVDALLDPALRAAVRSVAERKTALDEELQALPQPQMVFAAASVFKATGSFTPATRPRPVYLLDRGSDKLPGPEMQAGALSCLAGLPGVFDLGDSDTEGSRRAALARWITDPRNPLTARSIVNRIWQYHFGRGLVDTPSDFGHLGSLPTHHELLDWLACELGGLGSGSETDGTAPASSDPRAVAAGGRSAWSLKRLHKLILTSATYRQSSADNERCAAIDSGNQWLWRMNRQRLDAESIRDAVVAVSGSLDQQMGGASVQQFVFKDDHSPVYDYERFDVNTAAAHRRSVYRFIVRSVPDPLMECLDAADPSLLTPQRNTTLTPLQALSLLNNQLMIRQAEQFAGRLRTITTDPSGQIAAGYQLALGRPPRGEELATLVEFAHRQGLEALCRVLLNSNEFVFVD
ncbi:MAG: DUF1553 domain-containing protein [Planctomycetales bacterium]